MKRFLYIALFLLTCAVFFLRVIQAHAASKQPPFFVPQKVLDKMNPQEKLPPVENMTFEGKQMPVVVEMQQKAADEAEKKRLSELNEAKRRQDEALSAELQKQLQHKIKQAKLKAASKANKPIKDQHKPAPVAVKDTPLAQQPAKKPFVNYTPSNNYNRPTSSELTFDDIIADYKNDITAISLGQPINNPRLDKMLKDYNAEKHTLKIR